jgi:hypothetical protein
MWRSSFVAVLALLTACGGGSDYVAPVPPATGERTSEFLGLAVADLDADGLNDLATTVRVRQDRQVLEHSVSIYRQDAASHGTFLPAERYPYGTSGAYLVTLWAADLLGNGYPDIVATDWHESGFRLFRNDTAQPGRLLAVTHYPLGEPNDSFAKSVGIGDIDGDGLDDVVRVTDDEVYWVPQDGGSPGQFLAPIRIGPGTDDVVVYDVNGDELADVVTIGTDGLASQKTLIYRNNNASPAQFLPPVELVAPFFPHCLGVADYDANGLPDIAVSGSDPDLDDYVPNGSFMVFRQYAENQFSGSRVLLTESLGITDQFATGDLNGDRYPDVALTIGGKIALINIAAYERPLIFTRIEIPIDETIAIEGTSAPLIADVNNDRRPDVVFAAQGVMASFQDPGQAGRFSAPVRLAGSP